MKCTRSFSLCVGFNCLPARSHEKKEALLESKALKWSARMLLMNSSRVQNSRSEKGKSCTCGCGNEKKEKLFVSQTCSIPNRSFMTQRCHRSPGTVPAPPADVVCLFLHHLILPGCGGAAPSPTGLIHSALFSGFPGQLRCHLTPARV